MAYKLNKTITTTTIMLALTLGTSLATAQSNSSVSDQDKKFLHDLGEDSNFEIQSAQLALRKSQSADVKEYAHMIIADHTRLKQQLASADKTAGLSPTNGMSISDHAELEKLKLLSGKSFDDSYIKGLVKGNEDIQKMEKSEASDSTVVPIKSLAQHSADIDTKHADKAKQLAQAHNLQS